MKKLNGKSKDILHDNIQKLKQLFPDAFTEGQNVDFDVLREILGDYVDGKEERYSFNWNGKSQARILAQTPSLGTLKPAKAESKNWDTTQNLFIEGDNLEVLKLLQKSYHKKIKMIYIDPPYNTEGDFVYKDDYTDNIKNYLQLTGQVDDLGRKISICSEIDGRYHTNWLNMMYPRLKLAKNLLKNDGIICISIDDNELANLKLICDEIFGLANFEGHIHWRRRHNQPNDPTKMIGLVAEHILVYAKNSEELKRSGVGKVELTGKFSNPDDDPRGDWATKPWKVGSDQSGSRYTIELPSGERIEEEWMGEFKTYKSLLKDNRIIFPNNGCGAPRKKYFKFEREEEGQCATNWWPHEQFGHNQEGNTILTELMDGIKNTFSNPKPPKLIQNLTRIANCKSGDIVMDFFAGSGTIFQAVLERKFNIAVIGVSFPETLLDEKKEHKPAIEFCALNNKPKILTELTKERIRRAGEKIKKENKDKKGIDKLDIGFKVFKLDSSNIKEWDPDYDNLERSLEDAITNIKSDRFQEDVLYEILLKYGLDLTLPIEEKTISGKKVYSIGMGALIVCLDDQITAEIAEGIAKLKEEFKPEVCRVVFKDSGFSDDIAKTNACAILKQKGVEEVRSV